MKICITKDYYKPLIESLVFDLENFGDYELVTHDQANVLMLEVGEPFPGGTPALVIVYDWFNCVAADPAWFTHLKLNYPDSQIKFVTSIPYQTVGVETHFYDNLFNRTKAYYSQFPFRVLLNKTDRPWYYSGQESYKINLNLEQTLPGDCVEKIFVFCARIKQRTPRRALIAEHLAQYQHLGYYHSEDLGPNLTTYNIGLLSSMDDPLLNGSQIFNISTVGVDLNDDVSPSFFRGKDYFRGYAPVHVNYYNKSLITFVSESLETDVITVTEKTYDPIIHGHLVLPFGKNGLIQHMKSQGWRFADFIDYSYDDIADAEKRLKTYLHEIDRLLKIDLEEWKALYKQNIAVVHHNQRKFWLDPYYRMTSLLNIQES